MLTQQLITPGTRRMKTHQKHQDRSSPSLTSELNTVGIITVKPRTEEDVITPPYSWLLWQVSYLRSPLFDRFYLDMAAQVPLTVCRCVKHGKCSCFHGTRSHWIIWWVWKMDNGTRRKIFGLINCQYVLLLSRCWEISSYRNDHCHPPACRTSCCLHMD